MIQWGDDKTIKDAVIPMPSIMSWHGVTAGRTSSKGRGVRPRLRELKTRSDPIGWVR